MNRPIHFEVHADDKERAKKFYGDVFGWTFPEYPMDGGTSYTAISTGAMDTKEPGIHGGMVKRPMKLPEGACGSNAFVVTVQVADYDETEKKILAAGGIEAMGKFAIPGMAWQGYYIDTEGNTFGIHEADKNAQ